MTPNKREILSQTKKQFYDEIKKYQSNLKPTKEIEGFGSTAIVGEKSYPELKVYNISNSDKDASFFNTSKNVKKEYSDIVKLNAKNIMGNTNKIYIKHTNTRILNNIQNVYKSKSAVEFASKFENELKFNKPVINKLSGMLGTKNELKQISLNENTKTSKQIEKYTTNDIKSREAMINLYKRGTSEQQIINLLSLGQFGVQTNKKIVPTKWSNTAYDKTIEQYLHKKLITYKIIDNYEVYFYEDKGNSFLVILSPSAYCLESIEKMSNWFGVDFANHKNKLLEKDEPETAGGFYATKIAIFEALEKRKRQASIICIRLIDNYEIPLGVVFVRESVRECMKIQNQIFKTSKLDELKVYMRIRQTKYDKLFTNSKVLKEMKSQRRLNDFF